jgi:hypothetical protein
MTLEHGSRDGAVPAHYGYVFRRLFMTPVGFDERLAMAAQQLLRTHVVPLGWPAEARGDATMQQALQPSESPSEHMFSDA